MERPPGEDESREQQAKKLLDKEKSGTGGFKSKKAREIALMMLTVSGSILGYELGNYVSPDVGKITQEIKQEYKDFQHSQEEVHYCETVVTSKEYVPGGVTTTGDMPMSQSEVWWVGFMIDGSEQYAPVDQKTFDEYQVGEKIAVQYKKDITAHYDQIISISPAQ